MGEWTDDMMNGQGVMIKADGTKYKGGFKNGIFEGHGIMLDANGIKYEGDFKNGKKHGQGTEYDKDGKEIRSGEFLMGNFRGK